MRPQRDDGCWLVGDLGGTHLRLGLVPGIAGRLDSTTVFASADVTDLAATIEGFLDGLPARPSPRAACLAVAAPVEGDLLKLTNAGVQFSVRATREALGLDQLLVVNDVAALARSVPDLRPDELAMLAGDAMCADRTVVVVAPGTGLGVAALVPHRGGPVVIPGEGGHVPVPVTPAARTAIDLLLRTQDHVPAEDLVSGRGLPVLDVLLRLANEERAPKPRTAAEIARSGETLPGQVLAVFVELLAAVAQSHALAFGALGGVVLGGGFLRDLVPVLHQAGFREHFTRHRTMRAYLEGIPVGVDLRAHPALLGAARYLEDHR